MPQKTFTIRGKTYNLDNAADLVSIQNALVPENWPGKKPDGVRHAIAVQEILGFELRRYLMARYQKIAKAAIEEGADGGVAKMKVSFAFELDFSSPLVASVAGMKLSYSVRDVLTGKPKTVDLTQANFLDKLDSEDDMTKVLDTGSVTRELAEAEAEKESAKAAADAEKKGKKGKGGKVETFPTTPPLPEESETPPVVDKVVRRVR